MARNLELNARRAAVEALEAIPDLHVYDSKTPRNAQLPLAIVRKIGSENFEYFDDVGHEIASTLRVEIRARTRAQRDDLEEAVHAALLATERVIDRTLFYEGVDLETAGSGDSDVAYRTTFQYRMDED